MSKALIIGGNSDIAFEFCKILAANKYSLILASRNIKELQNKKNYLENFYKIDCKIYFVDIEKFNLSKDFIDTLDKDINLVLVASGYLENNEVNFKKIENVNYYGPKKIIENIVFNENFKKLQYIIAISSVAADRKRISNNTYALSKKKLSQFLKILSKNSMIENIIIKDIKPGYVSTKMIDNLPLAKPLISTPSFVAKKIFQSLRTVKREIYIPFYWKFILIIYNLIPLIFFNNKK
jgi:short-subunit dehydrogenase